MEIMYQGKWNEHMLAVLLESNAGLSWEIPFSKFIGGDLNGNTILTKVTSCVSAAKFVS